MRSVPDAVALVLSRHIGGSIAPTEAIVAESPQMDLFLADPAESPKVTNGAGTNGPNAIGVGTRCPQCGGFLVYQEGCERCSECDYNKCG